MKIIEVQITPADAMFHESGLRLIRRAAPERTTPMPVDGAEPEPPRRRLKIRRLHGREKAIDYIGWRCSVAHYPFARRGCPIGPPDVSDNRAAVLAGDRAAPRGACGLLALEKLTSILRRGSDIASTWPWPA